MTSHIHRIRQKERIANRAYFRENIEQHIKEDWEKYRQIDGIKKWINENPDKEKSLRKHRAALVRNTLKKQSKEKPDAE